MTIVPQLKQRAGTAAISLHRLIALMIVVGCSSECHFPQIVNVRADMKILFRRLVFAATAVTLLFAGAAHAQMDTSKSKITAISKQMNVSTEDTFKKFKARLDFDASSPATGSANRTIDTSSYDLGDESYNQQVRSRGWFDTARLQNTASASNAIAPAGGNQLKVSGKLTVKGKSENVTVPATATRPGTMQALDGTLPIKRSQFDIGSSERKDTSVGADEALIKFHIVEARK